MVSNGVLDATFFVYSQYVCFVTVAASAKFVYLSSNHTDFFKYKLPILFKTQLKHVP